tara:strand:+ start:117 stop:311 length:195 start_codon:yes stop_codon:yes gene_type:complete
VAKRNIRMVEAKRGLSTNLCRKGTLFASPISLWAETRNEQDIDNAKESNRKDIRESNIRSANGK